MSVAQTIMAVAVALGLSGPGTVSVGNCESTLRPFVISDNGHYGLYQLSRAHLNRFYSLGYTDWTDPAQMTEYVGLYVSGQIVRNGGSVERPNWREWSCGYRYYR